MRKLRVLFAFFEFELGQYSYQCDDFNKLKEKVNGKKAQYICFDLGVEVRYIREEPSPHNNEFYETYSGVSRSNIFWKVRQ